MCSRVLLLTVLCAPAWAAPIITGTVSIYDTRPAPYGQSASCLAPCSVSTISGNAAAGAGGGFDPAKLTAGVSTTVSGYSTNKSFAGYYVDLSVTESFFVSLVGRTRHGRSGCIDRIV